ncbi:MAG: efflux RND transporter periplasmic adaptor subunit [Chthoniobacterales bacterium]|nr:MAG: efflux RND transporter periplasmic adaptor subunit [Chthoniobacterales bacterium]
MNKRVLLSVIGLLVVAGILYRCHSGTEKDKEAGTEVEVQVGKIQRATLREYVTAYGWVEPEPASAGKPAGAAQLVPLTQGVLAEVTCSEGQHVDKGTVLFKLDSRVADIAVEKAQKATEFATANYERQQKILPSGGTSEKTLQESQQQLAAAQGDLATAKTEQSLLRVEAPFSGVITRILARPGEAVSTTTPLADLLDPSRLVASAQIAAAEISALHRGQSAEVRAEADAKPVEATLNYVSPAVDPKNGTVLVHVALPPDCGLYPGQFVTLRVVTREKKDCIAAPAESVFRDEEGHSVIGLVNRDKATLTPVKTGLRDGALVEVEGAGIKPGATVVTVGAYGLPKETKIRVATK